MEYFLKGPKTHESSDQHNERHIVAVQEILRSVHEEALFSLIADEVSKAGVDTQQLCRLIPISEIRVKEDREDINGSYSAADGISLYAGTDLHIRLKAVNKFESQHRNAERPEDKLQELLQILQITENDDHPLFLAMRSIGVIKTLIHEELHALSDAGLSIDEKSSDHGFSIQTIRQIGLEKVFRSSAMNYGTDQEPRRDEFKMLTGLNEAVTEIKARKLARAYLKSYPPAHVSSGEIDFVFDAMEGSYTKERFVCEQLFIILAAIADVPEDIVENAFFKAYFENDHALPLELVSAMSENSPEVPLEVIGELLDRLYIALEDEHFDETSEVNKIFTEVIEVLPEQKRQTINAAVARLFKKYNPQVLVE
jgi:hypothetical protein